MLTPVLLTFPTLLLPMLLSSPTRDCRFERMGDPAADARAIGVFESAVNDYASLHRRLERAWPPMWFISDLEQVESIAKEFRAVLRDARPQAARGGFFTPDVADLFRFRMAGTVREQNLDLEAMTSLADEAGTESSWTPAINEPLPWAGAGTLSPVFERPCRCCRWSSNTGWSAGTSSCSTYTPTWSSTLSIWQCRHSDTRTRTKEGNRGYNCCGDAADRVGLPVEPARVSCGGRHGTVSAGNALDLYENGRAPVHRCRGVRTLPALGVRVAAGALAASATVLRPLIT